MSGTPAVRFSLEVNADARLSPLARLFSPFIAAMNATCYVARKKPRLSGLDLDAGAEEGLLGAASRRSSPLAAESAAICRTLDSEGLAKAGGASPDDLRKFFSPVWDHSLDCPHALSSRRWLAGGKRQLGALTNVSLIDLRTQKRRRQRNLRKLPLSRYGRWRDRKWGSFNLSAKRFL